MYILENSNIDRVYNHYDFIIQMKGGLIMILQQKEVDDMQQHELYFNILLLNMKRYRQKLLQVSIYSHEINGRIVTFVNSYLTDGRMLANEKYKLIDGDLESLIDTIKKFFPHTPVTFLKGVNTDDTKTD